MTTTELSTRTWQGVTVPTPGTFALDPAHTHVGFVARHLMVTKVRGSFGEVSGQVTVAEDPTASTVEVSIRSASIDTGAADRDNHLRSPDFLDVEKYPELTFRGTGVVGAGAGFQLRGDLTIKDVTREVVLDVEYEGLVRDPWGREVIGFTATTEIDREDFGITWNQALETGGVLVGRTVKIEIEVEAARQS